jgi:ectoine hydroxylase-related dioxygenase (phytanoyl-CoA dioxygenase family)
MTFLASNYAAQGFLLVSGLIEPEVVRRARDAMCDWEVPGHAAAHHAYSGDSSIIACFSQQVCSVAAELAGASRPFAAPATVYTIRVSPQKGVWQWPEPHIDHALEQDAHRTFPPPFRIGCLIYVTDVSAHSGATVVWPGSHRQLEQSARSRPSDYEFLSALNRDVPKMTLAEPLEILARAGDVLFYHYLCAHAGSMNAGTQVRLALNHKW